MSLAADPTGQPTRHQEDEATRQDQLDPDEDEHGVAARDHPEKAQADEKGGHGIRDEEVDHDEPRPP